MKYRVISGKTQATFAEEVGRWLSEGWQLAGNLIVFQDHAGYFSYYQPITHNNEEKTLTK